MKENNELPVPINLPQGWLVKELGEVTNINMGQSPSSTAYNENGIGRYLIQGNADLKNRKTFPRIWTTDFPKTCAVGDIIMTVRAPVGAIARSLHEACIGRGVCSITTNVLSKDYLYHYLVSYESKWKALEQGSTFTAVNGKDIKGIKVLVPPLPEQQKIANVLSTVDEKIDVIGKQIEQTKELKKGLMQRLFTKGIGHTKFKDSPLGQIPNSWEVVKVGEVSKLQGGFAFKSSDAQEEGVRWLKIANVSIGKINWSDASFLPKGFEKVHPSFLLNEGDIVIAMTRPILGDLLKIAKIREKDAGCLLNQRVGKVVGSDKIDLEFIYQVFNSVEFINKLKKELLGSDPPNISSSMFEALEIAIPPLSEQRSIATIMSTVDKKLEILLNKKEQYQELKKGLMQQLLTGKLRVNHLIEQPELA